MPEQNTQEANKALMRRWFDEVWNKGRAEAIGEMFAADGVAHGLSNEPGITMKGPSDFMPFHALFRGAFPNIDVAVEDVIAEGDMVAVRCAVRGKHTGDHLGIAASNAPVHFTGMVFARIKDGKIVEAWNNFDFLAMNRQIGIN